MSATDTKKPTAATSENINEVFHEATRSYEKALKAGIQLQEESVNLWKDLLSKLGSPEEFQAKFESMTKEAFPKARERMEEFVETFNRTSKQTIDLLEKTLSVYQATSVHLAGSIRGAVRQLLRRFRRCLGKSHYEP
jgi:ribosomal 50S subunit-associated protein YjgA (DUF615 family)